MIELIFAIPVAALVITGGACLLYLCFAKVWITRAAREGAVCLQSQVSLPQCRSKVEQTLKAGLLFGTSTVDEFQKSPEFTRVRIGLRLKTQIAQASDEEPIVDSTIAIRNLK